MADNILEQIMDSGKKILDIDDVNGYSNNYGSVSFEGTNEGDELIVKNIDTFIGIGYSVNGNNYAESFNVYPTEDDVIYTTDNYRNNNDVNKAFKNYSHARNRGTVANDRQSESVLGQYNISTRYNSANTYGSTNSSYGTLTATGDASYTTDYITDALLIIGDGSGTDNRHNLLTIRSSCSGDDGEGTMSFSGSVDVDGHLNVADYVYSPTVYTDTLCYTNGDQYELTGGTETFRLFDDDDSEELTLENAKAKALEWVESLDSNKAFYRDPDSEEVYQITPNEESDVNVPVAKVETVDINALNMSITNNLFLTSGGGDITTYTSSGTEGKTYKYTDYFEAKEIQSPVLISGVFSDEFMEKYTIDYDTALKLAAAFDADLVISNDHYYTTSSAATSLGGQTIEITDENKITGSIEVTKQLSQYMYTNIDILDSSKLSEYNFIWVLRDERTMKGSNQSTLIPVNKNTKKISMSRMWESEIQMKTGNTDDCYFFPNLTDLTIGDGSGIACSQLMGSWWPVSQGGSIWDSHNQMIDVFPEYLGYTYYNSAVPTKDKTLNDKWNAWYRETKIVDCFSAADLNKLSDGGYDYIDKTLYEFVHDAAIKYLSTNNAKNITNSNSWDLKGIVPASTAETISDEIETYLSKTTNEDTTVTEDSTTNEDTTVTEDSSIKYTVSDIEGLTEYFYGDDPIIIASGDLSEIVPITEKTFTSSCMFSFTYNSSSLSELFKTYPATFSEYETTIKTLQSYYINSVLFPSYAETTKKALTNPVEYVDSSNTRYISQTSTGINTVTSLSFSDDSGSSILSLLGSEGSIDVEQISWENLIDALNQNKVVDILGTNLINLKTALSTASAGTYGITIGDDGSISLTEIE